jgi:hypothetical protein
MWDELCSGRLLGEWTCPDFLCPHEAYSHSTLLVSYDVLHSGTFAHAVKHKKNRQTPRLLVRKRTVATGRPPLVGEVSANFRG